MRSRRRRSSSKTVPSRKVWGGFTTFDTGNAISPIQLAPNEFIHTWILSPNDASDFYDEPTAVRWLFRFGLIIDIPLASIGSDYIASVHAAIMINKSDENANVPFVQLRDTTKDYIWHLHDLLWWRNGAYTGYNTLTLGPGVGQSAVVDIRSKRKIPEGYGLSFQCYNDPGVNTVEFEPISYSFFTAGRYLMLDH